MQRFRYLLGLVTLAAAVVAGAFLWNLLHETQSSELFHIRVEFRNARGLKAGADVRYRGVQVGVVHSVELRPDARKASVLVALNRGQEPLARSNSQFWIVTPRFGGITGGATGLDTLVRDAYLAFVTPEPGGESLPRSSSLLGSERPIADESEGQLEPVKHGDLLLTLLLPENHALSAGAQVIYRGVQTGEVRSIKLASEGTHVEALLRIDRQYRMTATSKSEFWIARPRLSGALLRGIALEDVGALLNPFVGYHTPKGAGLPVPENYRIAALAQRPDVAVEEVPDTALRDKTVASRPSSGRSLVLVRVVYEAIERDSVGPDDNVHAEGTGILYEDANGRILTICPRSICDGQYFVSDGVGEPEIEREKLAVMLADGTVLAATRVWVSEQSADLAVLQVEDPPTATATTPGSMLHFGQGSPTITRYASLGKDGNERSEPSGTQLPELAQREGAVAIEGELAVGVLGRKAGLDPTPVVVPLQWLPESLRPKS